MSTSTETLFDSHSHLHFHQFDNDREEIIKKLRDFNVKTINVGTDFEESEKAVSLAKKYPDLLWASVGLHPNDVFNEDFDISKYKELAKNEKVVAIGECGLDYFRLPSEAEITRQKEIFIKQIELAKESNKPIILHCRPSVGTQNAYEDAIEILLARRSFSEGGKFRNLHISSGNGVAHFFAGSKETAKKFLDLGFYISFAGPITFASEYREVVEYVPLDKILIETDAPFACPTLPASKFAGGRAAPIPHRGRRNEPVYVEFVARKIAELKNFDFEKVAEQTTESSKKLFHLKF